MEIAEFLLERIAEDVDVLTRPESFQHSSHGYDAPGTYSPTCRTCRQMVWGTRERAFSECEAKRRIVAEHETIPAAYPGKTIENDPCCETCSAGGEYPGQFPCQTLRFLAAVYADHPDYSPSWSALAVS